MNAAFYITITIIAASRLMVWWLGGVGVITMLLMLAVGLPGQPGQRGLLVNLSETFR